MGSKVFCNDSDLSSDLDRFPRRPLISDNPPFVHLQAIKIFDLLENGRNFASQMILATFNEKTQQISFVFGEGKSFAENGRLLFRVEEVGQ